LERALSERLGLAVTIEPAKGKPEQGRVTIAYQDLVQRTEDRDQRTEGERQARSDP